MDPTGRRFAGQREIAGEQRSGFEFDGVARLRGIDGSLQVAAGRHANSLPGKRRVGGVDEFPWQLRRLRWRERAERHKNQSTCGCNRTHDPSTNK